MGPSQGAPSHQTARENGGTLSLTVAPNTLGAYREGDAYPSYVSSGDPRVWILTLLCVQGEKRERASERKGVDASEQFANCGGNPNSEGRDRGRPQLASNLFVCPPQIPAIRANRNLISCSSVPAIFIHTQRRKEASPRPARTPELIVLFIVVIVNPVIMFPLFILVPFNHRAALPIRIHLTAVPCTLVCLVLRSSLCLRCMGASRAISRNPQLPHIRLFRRLQARCVRGQEAEHHLQHETRGPISLRPGQRLHACMRVHTRQVRRQHSRRCQHMHCDTCAKTYVRQIVL